MANNRIFLRCKHCKEDFGLAKRFGDEYYTSVLSIGQYETRLNEFLAKHHLAACTPEVDFSEEVVNVFELVYEH